MFINNLDPIAITIFNIDIRWYSLAYIIGLILAIQFGKFLIKKNNFFNFSSNILDEYLPFAIIGIILGGRLGYVLFYDLNFFLQNPINIFFIWEGGMSFHGGLVGIIIISVFFAKKNSLEFYKFTDLLSLITPIGLFLGRLANFINSELIGIPTNVPWSVIFIKIDNLPRHPSQIYEALLEGIMLFLLLNIIFKFKKIKGLMSSYFLIFYSIFRIFSEQFRLPDEQIGYIFNVISMGTLLSLIMLITGVFLLRYAKNN